ncbi:hypothetical protein [Halopiger goleimassiliensis]|uniref:hypothetical protein n=1 Tax=Halopiger goleimassiliensis TaxID=1293048 RepID=UPI000677C3F0|nr:hypothetical protein [Halopiger goleimassiliensis]
MTATRMAALLVVIAALGVTVVPAAAGAATVTNESTGSASESAPQANVSTLMQANAAAAEHSVESGLFDAAYENAPNESRADLVAERTEDIEAKLESLRNERAELLEEGNRSALRRHVGVTRLTVELRALERSIDRIEQRANETGADADRLEALRTNARDLVGPEVAETARQLPGFGDRSGGGPPFENVPPGQADDDRPRAAGNGSAGPPDGDRGPPSDDERGPPNGEQGPPNGDQDPPNEKRSGPNGTADGSDSESGSETNGDDGGDEATDDEGSPGNGPPDGTGQ